MAVEKHVEILRKGVEVWNKWREENPDLCPDLSGANLSRADLIKVNLSGADLSKANLRDARLYLADLRKANLSVADLRKAYLLEANLSEANLRFADLRMADLGLADLSTAILTDAHLRETSLFGANLRKADLRKAGLSGADLSKVNLSGADLRQADLRGANLRLANLSMANLSRTLLFLANLTGANFSGADLTEAQLSSTPLANVQLVNVTGLAAVNHHAPSTVGTDTLRLCEGKLPEKFLRGCGLADWEIEAARLYDPDLSASEREEIAYKILRLQGENPVQFYSSFISYSHADEAFSQRLHDQLQERGIRCWLDKKKIRIGQKILPIVLDAIRIHDRVVLCCSRDSLTSNWVQTEIEETFAKEEEEGREILLPLNLDGYLFKGWKGPMAVEVRKRLAADFTDTDKDDAKYKEQFEQVVSALTDSKKK